MVTNLSRALTTSSTPICSNDRYVIAPLIIITTKTRDLSSSVSTVRYLYQPARAVTCDALYVEGAIGGNFPWKLVAAC